MYGNCKTAEDVWQAVEVLFLSIKIARYMFNETIWIIALSYHNTSCSFIHCMDKNIGSINEKKIYFYPKYMNWNTGIVTWACSELCHQWSWDVFQNKSDFLDDDNQNTFCLTRSVAITIMWSTMWSTASHELPLVSVSYILFCLQSG